MHRRSSSRLLLAALLPFAALGAAEGVKDADADGVADAYDECPGSPQGAGVDARGCALDLDFDGVAEGLDLCASTPVGAEVDARGCTVEQVLQRRLPPQAIVPRIRMETREPEHMVASPGAPEPEPLATPAGGLRALVPVPLEAPMPAPAPPPAVAAAVPAPVGGAPTPAAASTPAPAPTLAVPAAPTAAPLAAGPAVAVPAVATAPPVAAKATVNAPTPPPVAKLSAPVPAAVLVPAGPPTVLYNPGVTDLSDGALAQLDALLPELKVRLAGDAQATLSVLGYADARTEPRSGEKLAETRAALVRSYLIARGLDRTRVRAVARGFATAEAGGAKANRRVELRFDN